MLVRLQRASSERRLPGGSITPIDDVCFLVFRTLRIRVRASTRFNPVAATLEGVGWQRNAATLLADVKCRPVHIDAGKPQPGKTSIKDTRVGDGFVRMPHGRDDRNGSGASQSAQGVPGAKFKQHYGRLFR